MVRNSWAIVTSLVHAQYTQDRSMSIGELESRLEEAGRGIGHKLLELQCWRDKQVSFFSLVIFVPSAHNRDRARARGRGKSEESKFLASSTRTFGRSCVQLIARTPSSFLVARSLGSLRQTSRCTRTEHGGGRRVRMPPGELAASILLACWLDGC